jgi:hypothetical protein
VHRWDFSTVSGRLEADARVCKRGGEQNACASGDMDEKINHPQIGSRPLDILGEGGQLCLTNGWLAIDVHALGEFGVMRQD